MKTAVLPTQISPMEEGWIIVVVGMTVVFLSLIVLYAVFQFGVPWVLRLMRQAKTGFSTPHESTTPEGRSTSGEEMAAVAAAVYLYTSQIHDEENAILTINKARKDYAPWSSKIYVTHNVPPRQT